MVLRSLTAAFFFRLFALLCAGLIATACGGGGGAAVVPAGSAPASSTTTTFALTLPVPHAGVNATARRSATYVSPSSASISIAVVYPAQTVSGAIVNLLPPSTVCTVSGTTESCQISIVAQAGATNFILSIYDQANAQGNLLSTETVAVPPATNGSATVAVTLVPVAGSIALQVSVPFISGVPSTTTLLVSAFDADGNPIPAGPLVTPITLTTTSSHFTLSAATITDTSQPVTVTYDGGSVQTGSLVANVNGTTYALNPIGASSFGPLTVTPSNIMLQVGGKSGTFTVQQSGGGGSIAITSSCAAGAALTFSPTLAPVGATATTVTVAPVSAPNGTPTHACTLTFTGPASTATATVDITATSVGIQ